MNPNVESSGGDVLLVIVFIVVVVVIIAIIAALVKGWHKVEASDRKRAVQRNIRQQVADAEAAQAYARKLLSQREGK